MDSGEKKKEEKKKKYLEAEKLFRKRQEFMKTEGNDSKIDPYKMEIFNILYEIISLPLEKVSVSTELALGEKDIDTILYIIRTYDLEKGPLEKFANHTWTMRQKVKEIVLESIDGPIGTGNTTKADTIPGPDGGDTPKTIEDTENGFSYLVNIANDINQLYLNKHSMKNENLKLIFTDVITNICKNEVDNLNTPAVLNRQKSIINGMDMDFLDFYMAARCRSLKAVQDTNLKKWKDIAFSERVIKKENIFEEPDLPLPNKIYTCFVWSKNPLSPHNSIEVSISNSKNDYTQLLKELGLEKFIANINSVRKTDKMNEESKKRVLTDSPLKDVMIDYLRKISADDWRDLKAVQKGLSNKIDEMMLETCRKIKDCYESLKDTKTTSQEIIQKIAEQESINQRLVSDTIRAIKQSESNKINIIVKKVQDDNLYSYYWM